MTLHDRMVLHYQQQRLSTDADRRIDAALHAASADTPLIMQPQPQPAPRRWWPRAAVAAGLALLLAGGVWLSNQRSPANPIAPSPNPTATPTPDYGTELLFDTTVDANVDWQKRLHNPNLVLKYTAADQHLQLFAPGQRDDEYTYTIYATYDVIQVGLSDLDSDGIREVCFTSRTFTDNPDMLRIAALSLPEYNAETNAGFYAMSTETTGNLSIVNDRFCLPYHPSDSSEPGTLLALTLQTTQLDQNASRIDLWLESPYDQQLFQLYDDAHDTPDHWGANAATIGLQLRWQDGELREILDGETPLLTVQGKDKGVALRNAYLADVNNDGTRELCVTLTVGLKHLDDRIYVLDRAAGKAYELSSRGNWDRVLRAQNGKLSVYQQFSPYVYTAGLQNLDHFPLLLLDNQLIAASESGQLRAAAPSTDAVTVPSYFQGCGLEWYQSMLDAGFSLTVNGGELCHYNLQVSNGKSTLHKTFAALYDLYFTDLDGDSSPELCATVLAGIDDLDTQLYVYSFAKDREYTLSQPGVMRFMLYVDQTLRVATSPSRTGDASGQDDFPQGCQLVLDHDGLSLRADGSQPDPDITTQPVAGWNQAQKQAYQYLRSISFIPSGPINPNEPFFYRAVAYLYNEQRPLFDTLTTDIYQVTLSHSAAMTPEERVEYEPGYDLNDNTFIITLFKYKDPWHFEHRSLYVPEHGDVYLGKANTGTYLDEQPTVPTPIPPDF